MNNKEINERLALLLFLNGAKPGDIQRYYSSEIGQQFERMYLYYYFANFYAHNGYVSQPKENAYRELASTFDLVANNPMSFLNKYRLDYLVKGYANEKERIFPEFNPEYLQPIAEFKNYKVFRVVVKQP